MKHCSGACDQGRKACPAPAACEQPEDDGLLADVAVLGWCAFLAVVVWWLSA